MPIYEYRCQECQQTFEEWQKDFAERPVPCPVCGGKSERLISNTAFVLKGGGWYSDLYSKPAGSSGGSQSSSPSPAPKAEAATASASTSASGAASN
ncbi:hypothetical protein NNJEOMEG_03237 [Fundidesulfovibrio magnetotacticus]|uniref:Putative regulatory protein FmdB zinc ribbon domain-containing protein n=1 Tax=Fundidesulfovibrio magnetotacticus TaxID=2730080 RepID=A0A6V8M4L1_9BACT|nr:zinc ribbon domain-containing protein [Fundidesulfovibrio magnetotacticus]GFK95375.1 hypothetical protein NNJEOMEG_03237 [Fundidesulfovibrio magnetotacticus]